MPQEQPPQQRFPSGTAERELFYTSVQQTHGGISAWDFSATTSHTHILVDGTYNEKQGDPAIPSYHIQVGNHSGGSALLQEGENNLLH